MGVVRQSWHKDPASASDKAPTHADFQAVGAGVGVWTIIARPDGKNASSGFFCGLQAPSGSLVASVFIQRVDLSCCFSDKMPDLVTSDPLVVSRSRSVWSPYRRIILLKSSSAPHGLLSRRSLLRSQETMNSPWWRRALDRSWQGSSWLRSLPASPLTRQPYKPTRSTSSAMRPITPSVLERHEGYPRTKFEPVGSIASYQLELSGGVTPARAGSRRTPGSAGTGST
jgi:hypothetical protein